MKTIGIIPARYGSSRFPGKPLALINGQSMIKRVYDQASKAQALTEVWVATDDQRIFDHVKSFGGQVVMTKPETPTGTDRAYEAFVKINSDADFVANIQGDEPFLRPALLNQMVNQLTPQTQALTSVKKVTKGDEIFNPDEAKVVIDNNNHALYFSRSPIPYVNKTHQNDWVAATTFYKHVGIYIFRADVLKAFTNMPPTPLEAAESLEQLRLLQNGYQITVMHTEYEMYCIDRPQDIQRLEYLFNKQAN